MEIVLTLLAIAGATHFLKNTSGPFNLFDTIRNLLTKLPLVGGFFVKLFTCDFCSGFWASVALYLLLNPFSTWKISEAVIWIFGGAMVNLLVSQLLAHMDTTKTVDVKTDAEKVPEQS